MAERPAATVAARALAALAWAGVVAYLPLAVVLGQRSQGAATAASLLATGATAALIALSALCEHESRRAWWWVAGALALDVWGALLGSVLDPGPAPVSGAAWSDLLTVPGPVVLVVGVILLTQGGVGRVDLSARLDGLTAGLATAAVVAALAYGQVLRVHGTLSSVAIGLARPLLDLVLVVLLVAGLAPRRYRPTWSSGLVAAGVSLMAAGDVVRLVLGRSQGLGSDPTAAVWLGGMALLGLAAWAPTRHRRPSPAPGPKAALLAVPALVALGALGLVAVAPFARFSALASILAVGAVASALARMLLTVRELRRLHESHQQARTDELTGLPNRRSFFEQLDRRLSSPVVDHAIFIVDLDGFKAVNDTYGHQAGDDLLKAVSARLRRRLADHVALARLGGDEFGAVAPVRDAEEAVEIGRTITDSLTEPFALEAATVKVGASVGIGLQPDHGTTREELLHTADVAMYDAKRAKAGVALYDAATDPNSKDRLALATELRAAITSRNLELHYQPAVRASDGALCGFEALVRWRHPRLGLLTPDRFVDLASADGAEFELTEAVLEQAVGFAAGLFAEGRPLPISVNLSDRDIAGEAVAHTVAGVLAAYGLPPSLLTLEVTERALVEDPAAAGQVLAGLRQLGVRIALDDVGSCGYPLARLAKLPVDDLKLHPTVVTPVAVDPAAEAVVEALSLLARRRGMGLVGVGAEDPTCVRILTRLGVDRLQGFHICPPLDRAALLRHLGRYAPTG